jgi:integrase/recombinase XerD
MTEIAKKESTSTERQLAIIEGLEGDHYQYHIRQFVDWMRERGGDLSREAIIDYFADLNNSDYSNGTKRIKRQALKKRLRQLAQYGGIGSDLSVNLEQFLRDLDRETRTKAPKVNTHHVDRERYLTKDEARQVVAACRGPRQTMIIKFLWATGARVSELIGIRLGDCKKTGDTVHIRVVGKGNKERWLKISAELYDRIRSVFRGEQYLFETGHGKPYHRTYISNQIAKVTQRAVGRPMRAHSMRHSFATRKIKEGVQIGYVSRYLGHSSLSITSDMYDHGEIETGDLVGDEI